MLEQLIVGFLNVSAIKIVTIISRFTFRRSTDELSNRVDKLTAQAVEKFQSKHEGKYGRGSFLDRESNWQLIAESLRQDKPSLSALDFNLQGFEDAPKATIDDVKELVEIIRDEFNTDLFLSTLLTVKDISNESKKTREEVKELLNMLSGTETLLPKTASLSESEGENLNIRYIDDYETKDEFIEGKIYTRKLTEDVKMEFMLGGDVLYSEIQLHDGAKTYYEVSKKDGVVIRKVPYPDMKLIVPDEFVLERRWDKNEEGKKQFIIEGKWGLKVIWTFIELGSNRTNVNMEKANLRIVANKKEIIVTPKAY